MPCLMFDDEAVAGLIPSNNIVRSTTVTGTTNSAGNVRLFADDSKVIIAAYCTSTENVCLSVNRSGDGALWASANQRGTMNAITNTSLTILVYYFQF